MLADSSSVVKSQINARKARWIGRLRQIAKLYARGLDVSEELTELIVARTKGVSAAFIKELMRRRAI